MYSLEGRRNVPQGTTWAKLPDHAKQQDMNEAISAATQQGRVTLLTRSYGRGTDFVVRDMNVIQQGGVHVIGTFIPESRSELAQLSGRTSRQGQ